jgi:hypothetical protein
VLGVGVGEEVLEVVDVEPLDVDVVDGAVVPLLVEVVEVDVEPPDFQS